MGSDFKATLSTLQLQSRIRELVDSMRKRDVEIGEQYNLIERLKQVIAELRKPEPKPVPDESYFMLCEKFGDVMHLRPLTTAQVKNMAGIAEIQYERRAKELERQLNEALHRNLLLEQQLADWKQQHWEGPL